MKIILSLLTIVIYWCLNAYEAMLNFHIPFMQAILIDYDNNHIFIKLAIIITIFIVVMIATKTKEKTDIKRQDDLHPHMYTKLSALYIMSDTILSPLPLNKQLNSVVDTLEEKLNVKTAFITSFKDDKIIVLNTNKSLTKIGIKKEYTPLSDDLVDKSIDKLLSVCYKEKLEHLDDYVHIGISKYRILIHPYKDNMLKSHIGVIAILLNVNDKKEYKSFLEKACEQISFTINLTNKKDELLKAQQRHHAQFTAVDTELNIASNFKIQETIEYEIKMAQRYNSSLSLIVIAIDDIRSIANVFREEETVEIKKEIASLIKKMIRETDAFGRWTNNNFVIVVPHLDYKETKKFATKLSKIIKEHKFKKIGKLTCSFGITSFYKKDTIGQFRQRAENALQSAINKGANSIDVKILS